MGASMAPIHVADIGSDKCSRALTAAWSMDIPEQAQPREDETDSEGPDLYDEPPHGQAA